MKFLETVTCNIVRKIGKVTRKRSETFRSETFVKTTTTKRGETKSLVKCIPIKTMNLR